MPDDEGRPCTCDRHGNTRIRTTTCPTHGHDDREVLVERGLAGLARATGRSDTIVAKSSTS